MDYNLGLMYAVSGAHFTTVDVIQVSTYVDKASEVTNNCYQEIFFFISDDFYSIYLNSMNQKWIILLLWIADNIWSSSNESLLDTSETIEKDPIGSLIFDTNVPLLWNNIDGYYCFDACTLYQWI